MLGSLSGQQRACVVLRYVAPAGQRGHRRRAGNERGDGAGATAPGPPITAADAGGGRSWSMNGRTGWPAASTSWRTSSVPELWEQIVGRADTEPNVDVLRARRRRWVPLAVAAAVLALARRRSRALGARRHQPTSTRRRDRSIGDNTRADRRGRRARRRPSRRRRSPGSCRSTSRNPGDGYHGVEIRRMQPGDDVRRRSRRRRRSTYATGATDDGTLLVGTRARRPRWPGRPTFSAAMPLEAGEYAVFVTTTRRERSSPRAGSRSRGQAADRRPPATPVPRLTPTLHFDRIGTATT